MKKTGKNANKGGQNAKMIGRRVDFSMKPVDDQERIETDPYGSYTGVPSDPDDIPVQDVDDL